jgi:hypothetical protein
MQPNTNGYVDFNLAGQFQSFSYVACISSGAPDGARFRFEVFLDGQPQPSVDLSRDDQPSTQSVATSGHNRLRVKLTRLDASKIKAVAGYGSAILQK